MEGGFIGNLYNKVSNAVRYVRGEQQRFQDHLQELGIDKLCTMSDDEVHASYRPAAKDRYAVYKLSWPRVQL